MFFSFLESIEKKNQKLTEIRLRIRNLLHPPLLANYLNLYLLYRPLKSCICLFAF